ncbi:MAG: thioredoxin-disulfide reductase [Candidatus Aenigmarchaeota archaeon]|nr:thioredoxin-disulfide reductase [Candidatus Aenigmarchaeota archaeon]
MGKRRKLVIIGSGPAGYTAATYAARADLEPLVLAGEQHGGQLMLTSDVENYPGFPDGIQGPELMDEMRKQAERFGAEVVYENVTEVDFTTYPFEVRAGEVYEADAVIISTGASAKLLGLESEKRLFGRGVSACATCDGPLFRGKEVVVVGGGDAAIEEALFLSKFASKVTVVHRRDELRASKVMQERAFGNKKIDFVWDTTIDDIYGDSKVEGVKMKNIKDGYLKDYECDGVFVAIGHEPSTKIFSGKLELDEKGYVKTRDVFHDGILEYSTMTSVDGVFSAGDVSDYRYRQAVTAAGEGCKAALDAERWLERKKPK